MVQRVRAFLVHLVASIIIVLLGGGLVFWLWYPAPLREAVGAGEIFLLLLFVDALLGPLLTFVVYKVGKKTLVFDLVIIAFLQLAALLYGFSILAEGRPVWLVFSVDRFDLVRELDIDVRQLESADEQYRDAPLFGPRWVAAVIPEDVVQRNAIIFEALEGGADISPRPNLYQPLESAASAMRNKAHHLDELQEYNAAEVVRQVLARWPEADAWLPLKATVRSQVVLINKETAKIVAVVDLAPW